MMATKPVDMSEEERDLVLFALGMLDGRAGFDYGRGEMTPLGRSVYVLMRKLSTANFSPPLGRERIETTTVKRRPKGTGKKSN